MTLESVLDVAIDIKPQSCPNPLNVNSKGVLPVGLLGGTVDLTQVDLTTIALAGVGHVHVSAVLGDVARPFRGTFTGNCLDCTTGFDGVPDLLFLFRTQKVVQALGAVSDGQCVTVKLTGKLKNGTPFEAEDVVRIIKKGK